MYTGKTLFAQIMDFLPWSTFHRIVARYGGDYRIRTFRCTEQFRVLAFAQLTYRESLRDIEACLSAQESKLYHMGISRIISRSTLADANESRDWRIYADFAQRLITQARKLYAGENLGLDLSNTVYALDSTTIDLCLSMFPWAPFRATKAAVKVHMLLDLRGAILSFIHITGGKWHDVNILDLLIPEPGAFYIMDRAYLDFARLYALHQAGSFFVTRTKSNLNARRVYSAPTDRSTGIICDQSITLKGYYSHSHYPEYLRRIRFKDAESGKTLNIPYKQHNVTGSDHLYALQASLADRAVLQVDQTAPKNQTVLWHIGKCRKNPNLGRHFYVCAHSHNQEKAKFKYVPLHITTDFIDHPFRKNAFATSTSNFGRPFKYYRKTKPVESIQFLTGQ